MEAIAKEKMEAFLEEEFDDFRIKDYRQKVIGDMIEGYDIYPFTLFDIKIEGKMYNFVYEADEDRIWSDYYYEKVCKELENKLSNNEFLSNANQNEIVITCGGASDMKLLVHEDDNLEEVIRRLTKDNNPYLIEAYYFFENEENFNPYQYDLEKVCMELPYWDIYLYNISGEKNDISDTLECSVKDSVDEEGREEIYINYRHNKSVKIDNVIFSYNDLYYDLTILPIEYKDDDPIRDYYTQVDFRCPEQAYLVEYKLNKPIEENFMENSYVTRDNKIVYIEEVFLNALNLYYNGEDFENHYVYTASKQHMTELYSGKGRQQVIFYLDKESDSKETIVFYCKDE